MSHTSKGFSELLGKSTTNRILKVGITTILSLFVLRIFPYYSFMILGIMIAGIAILSIRYPAGAMVIAVFLSIPAALFQNVLFGVAFAVLGIVSIVLCGSWINLILAIAGWVFAFSPLPVLSFAPIILAGVVLGSKDGAKIGASLALSLFLLGWINSRTTMGLMVIPYFAPPLLPERPPLELWTPLSALYDLRMPDPVSYQLILASLFRNFSSDVSFYVEFILWTFAGYVGGFVTRRWTLQHRWLVGAVIGFVPIAAANAFASMFFVARVGFEAILALCFCIVCFSFLEFTRSDIARMTALQKAKKAEITATAQLLETSEGTTELGWDQVGGYEDVKREIRDMVLTPFQRSDLAEAYGIKRPRGILLFGPPGCGKTLIMKALAQTIKANFYYVKTSDVLSKWYGESEKRVKDVFTVAKSTAPSILFFDEIDAIGKKRDMYVGDDVTPRLLSLMLAEMDGMEERAEFLVVGATNKPELLDPAILRPGRFDKVMYVPPPDKSERVQILRVHCKDKPMNPDVNYEKLAQMTDRFSGADIQNVIQLTAMDAVREAMKKKEVVPIKMEDLVSKIQTYKPSITLKMLEDYEKLRLDFERTVTKVEEELKPKVTFEKVGGLDNVKQILMEAVELPLKHSDLTDRYGLSVPKGILLFGPPGVGKTYIAKAAAGSMQVAFMTISGAELSQKAATDAASVVREVFYRARENAPSIVFIDEIETIAPSREIAAQSTAVKPISQMLIEMDGLRDLKNVIVMAATNKPSWIDSALLRPGRFDKIVYISPPDAPARKQIFQIHLANSPVSDDLDYERLAEMTAGYSGADIANIVREAKTIAIRDTVRGVPHEKITLQDLLRAVEAAKPSITTDSLKECEDFLRIYGERK